MLGAMARIAPCHAANDNIFPMAVPDLSSAKMNNFSPLNLQLLRWMHC
jgi:hypothetical protein